MYKPTVSKYTLEDVLTSIEDKEICIGGIPTVINLLKKFKITDNLASKDNFKKVIQLLSEDEIKELFEQELITGTYIELPESGSRLIYKIKNTKEVIVIAHIEDFFTITSITDNWASEVEVNDVTDIGKPLKEILGESDIEVLNNVTITIPPKKKAKK